MFKILVRHKAVVARTSAKRKQNTNVIMVTYEYTYQDHEYIIRTMNTKHDWTVQYGFLLQAAHKIAVSCLKVAGKWFRS